MSMAHFDIAAGGRYSPPVLAPSSHEGPSGRYRHLLFRGHKTVRRQVVLSREEKRPTSSAAERLLPAVDPDTSAEVRFVRNVLRACGLDVTHYRLAPLIRRIPACLRALREESIPSAAAHLEGNPHRLAVALNSLLIGSTSFFRDKTVFDYLENVVVPALLARGRPLRVRSIASSDGAELYSVAMLFARHGPLPGSRFLGTDCREDAVAAARRGVYHRHATAAVPPELAEMFLRPAGPLVSVSPRLTSRVGWECGDILREQETATWDLILCRNLAIYLDTVATRSLWDRLHARLSPGGILVVGKAEKPHAAGLRRIAPCIYENTSR